MTQIDTIRHMDKQGIPRRQIAETLNISRNTVQKYADKDDFNATKPCVKTKGSIIDPYKPIINKILMEDKKRWTKQRHTASRIYQILKETHGYAGGYTTVQKYVRESKKQMNMTSTYNKLHWLPGEAQVDFGEADFIIRGEKVRRNFLVMSFPYSNMAYFQVFGGVTGECVCQGLKDIFEYIGGVPTRIIFDNATGIGHRTKSGMIETDLFKRFRMHYNFEATFCNPYSGYEKGNVERKVAWVRNNVFTPEPHFSDIKLYNKKLLLKADEYKGTSHYLKSKTWGELFKDDVDALTYFNPKDFEVMTYKEYKTDKYGYVCIDGKHEYQLTGNYALSDVLVCYYAHDLIFLNMDGEVIVQHERIYSSEKTTSDNPTAQLSLLRNKPGAWRNSTIREEMPETISTWIDSLDKPDLKQCLNCLCTSSIDTGYDPTISALNSLINSNTYFSVNDISVYAKRIATFGDIPPASGPDLEVYNDYFLRK